MKDDWGGFILLVIMVAGGAYFWSRVNDYAEEPPPIETLALPATTRPSGLLQVTTFENGTVWRLDADTLRGPDEARLAWIIEDHSSDKSVSKRETKTLYRIDCNTTAYQTLQSVEYDNKGSVVRRWTEAELGDDVSYPPPRSNIAAVVDMACSEVFSKPKESSLPPIAAPPGSG